jgi:hypothetical protein
MDGCAAHGLAPRCELLLVAMTNTFNVVPNTVSAAEFVGVRLVLTLNVNMFPETSRPFPF